MNTIPIDRDALLQSLKELDFLVVSLDRIGSTDLTAEARENVVYRFVIEGDVFRRLASIRRLLFLFLDEDVSPDERVAIEKELEMVPVWDYRDGS